MILSVPSYVIPGTYAENLRFLADKTDVEGVELLFYFWDAETLQLIRRETPEVLSFGGRFRYTAHLPDSVGPEHREILDVVGSFARSFVVHPPKEPEALPAFVDLLDLWRADFGDRFFLENVRVSSFNRARKALPDIPLCVDLGHLQMEGIDPASFVAELAADGRKIAELHLHGLAAGVDHKPFGADPWLIALAPFLRGFDGVSEIELFAWNEAAAAIAAIQSVVQDGHPPIAERKRT
jgi:hypothetical protein